MNQLWTILAAALLITSTALAQSADEKKLLSSGPALVRVMPAVAQWSVDFTYTSAAASFEAIRAKRAIITKSGEVRHEEIVYENGIKSDLWKSGHMEVESRSGQPKLLTRCVSGDSGVDFPELEWISPKNFIGIRTDNDRQCFVFQEERFNEFHAPIGTATALVDVEKRLPVAYRFQSELRRYTILPAPTAPVAMPANFAAAGKTMLDHINKTTPHLSAP